MAEEDSIGSDFQAADDDSEGKSLYSEESGSFVGVEDINMSIVYPSVLSVPSHKLEPGEGRVYADLTPTSSREVVPVRVNLIVRAWIGCLNYSYSPWEESEKPDVYQRQLYYKFDKCISRYRGEVTSTQQRSRLSDKDGWLIEEVMTLHGIPLGDYFNLRLGYQVENVPRSTRCSVQVQLGIAWLKYSRHQKRITKNIVSNLQERLLVMCSGVEKEYLSKSDPLVI